MSLFVNNSWINHVPHDRRHSVCEYLFLKHRRNHSNIIRSYLCMIFRIYVFIILRNVLLHSWYYLPVSFRTRSPERGTSRDSIKLSVTSSTGWCVIRHVVTIGPFFSDDVPILSDFFVFVSPPGSFDRQPTSSYTRMDLLSQVDDPSSGPGFPLRHVDPLHSFLSFLHS